MYSQTTSLFDVTSKIRPADPSQINVLPLGSRSALLISGLKKEKGGSPL